MISLGPEEHRSYDIALDITEAGVMCLLAGLMFAARYFAFDILLDRPEVLPQSWVGERQHH